MSVSIFRQTPASVATVSMVRRRESLRTAAIAACPDRFGPFLTETRSRHRDLMRSGERVSVDYGPEQSGHAEMTTILSASRPLAMDTVATKAGARRNIGYMYRIVSRALSG